MWPDLEALHEDEEVPPEFAVAVCMVARDLLASGEDHTVKFAKYVNDPIAFFREQLCVDPWESEDPAQHGQDDLIRAVNECDRVACKSGHKIGKSITAIGLALWWVATRTGARVLLTAPTFNQVKGILWRELRNIDRATGIAHKLGAEVPLDPTTGLQLPNGNEIVGISTKTPENIAGISGANLLFIIDEASGYPDDLWEVLSSGNAAGGAKIFCISNPTRTAGWFFELFRKRANGWVLFTISSENTPNVRSGKRLIPGLATREFIDEMRDKCGAEIGADGQPAWRTDPVYCVRILGEFPKQGTDAVIHLEILNAATKRWKAGYVPPSGDLTIGVDVARFGGDSNCIWPVRDLYAYEPVEAGPGDGHVIGQRVIDVASDVRLNFERVRVNVDGIGVGASVVDYLKNSQACQDGWLCVVDLNAGESPDDNVAKDYPRLRDQLWFGIRDWLKSGGALPAHDVAEQELLCATYSFDVRNKMKVIAKDVMREILGHSPDFADALAMAVYRGKRGRWYEFEYTAAPDFRHPQAQPKWGDDDDSDALPRRAKHSYL